jgi:hypothetical protein
VTSGIPAYRPGTLSQPDTDQNARIARLEQMLEELQRKDMNRATVGQGGTFRGYYDNGQLAFTFGEDIDDGVRKVRMNYASNGGVAFQVGPGNPAVDEPEQFKLVDQAGNKVFATDGLAGYGLAEPSFQHLMVQTPGLAWVSGVAQPATVANTFFYNPVVYSQVLVRNFAGGVTAMAGKLRVTDGSGNFVESSSSAAVGGNATISRVVLLPASYINAQNCRVEWMMTPTGSGTADVWPRTCRGTGKAFYDFNPTLQ